MKLDLNPQQAEALMACLNEARKVPDLMVARAAFSLMDIVMAQAREQQTADPPLEPGAKKGKVVRSDDGRQA